jgi:phage tail sheath gpL-like
MPTPPSADPKPLRRARRDGWTASRQDRFIAALTVRGSVAAASAAAGITRASAYQLRADPRAPGFAHAWDAALAAAAKASSAAPTRDNA